MKTSVVTTTINVPRALDSYIENSQKYGHGDISYIIVGDRKTPKETYEYINSLKKRGIDATFLDLAEQDAWLEPYPGLRALLPYNSIQRRNIGYLYAAERDAEIIITIDDDNFVPPDEDYFGEHLVVNTIQEIPAASSSTGWVNVCSLLHTEPEHKFYHRGFPLTERWRDQDIVYRSQKKRVVVNAGLWTGDPDVDTITRFEEPFVVTGSSLEGKRIALDESSWHPFNSQNTAFFRDVLPCFFLITIGKITNGHVVENFRYDDIWMSYFSKIAIDHMGDQITFGHPIVHQARNPHDYLLDLQREMPGIIMIPKLIDMIRDIKLTSGTYSGSYSEITEHLKNASEKNNNMTDMEKKYIDKTVSGMQIWNDVCSKIM